MNIYDIKNEEQLEISQAKKRNDNVLDKTSFSHQTPKRVVVEAPSGTGGPKASQSQWIPALSLVNFELFLSLQ